MTDDDSKMTVRQDRINLDKDHKLEKRLEFPYTHVFMRHSENHQSTRRPSSILQSLPRDDVKKESYSWMKHISLLVSLTHHRRTNNNRIINISQLVLVTCLVFMSLLILSSTAEAKKNASSDFDHLNAKAVQFHGSTSSVLVPMQTSVSYSTAYSGSRLPSGFNKNKKRPGTVRNVSKFRKHLHHRNSTNNASNSTQAAPNKVINDRSTIARPFFTKITSDDAIAKPSSYFDSIFKLPSTSSTTSRSKDTDSTVSNLSKPSKLFTSDKDAVPTGLTSATEKSFLTTTTARNNDSSSSFLIAHADSGPKIRLEPFFNFLSNFQSLALGTSKEQNFSPSYQTITQSIDENTKRTKANKSTKGLRERNKHKKIRSKISKMDGPIPIPLPERVVDPADFNGDVSTTAANKSTLHPMDVLNIPMNPPVSKSYFGEEASPTEVHDVGREALDSHTFFGMDDARNSTFSVKDNTRGYLGFDKYNQNNDSEIESASESDDSNQSPSEGEGRLRSGSIIDNFHDQDVDLQAEETVTLLHMDPSPTPITSGGVRGSTGRRKKKRRKGSGRHVNIPPGFTTPTDIDAAHSHFTEHRSDPQRQYNDNDFNPIPGPPSLHYNPTNNSPNRIRDDLTMISKYPISFDYNSGPPTNIFRDDSKLNFGRVPQNFPRISNHGPTNKFRPNLNSHYDQNYHKFAAVGETNGFPPMPVSNGYANPYTGGSHYVGLTHFGQDDKGSLVIPPQTIPTPGKPPEATSDLDTQGSSSDTTFNVDIDKSSNQKIGIMNSFELFYTNYKILAWASFLIVTSLALLAMLVYLYVNNPPTEVVQARENYFSVDNLLGNPQILKFLSSLVESHKSGGNGKQKRKRFKKESMQSTTGQVKKQL